MGQSCEQHAHVFGTSTEPPQPPTHRRGRASQCGRDQPVAFAFGFGEQRRPDHRDAIATAQQLVAGVDGLVPGDVDPSARQVTVAQGAHEGGVADDRAAADVDYGLRGAAKACVGLLGLVAGLYPPAWPRPEPNMIRSSPQRCEGAPLSLDPPTKSSRSSQAILLRSLG